MIRAWREITTNVVAAPYTHWLERLASLKLTAAIIAAIAGAVAYSFRTGASSTWSLAVPLSLFAVNLGAAVATNPAFRRQSALLVFHLALLAVIMLVAAGRLTYLKGKVEISEGEAFSGEAVNAEAGPLHAWALSKVSFVNEGFSIDYAPGLRRGKTVNRVRWSDEEGREQAGWIGDHYPLVLHGYRFYTSFNKGFAPVFLWLPQSGGAPQRGTVHLPGYPAFEFQQAQDWQPPGSQIKVWVMLQFDEVILAPEKPSQFRLPKEHKLIVRVGDERREMVPGSRYALPEGVLVYEGLRTWMGYTVYSDWTTSWLLAACAVAVLSLGWHFWTKFAAQPWRAEEEIEEPKADGT